MTKQNDGGPAFPVTSYDTDGAPYSYDTGMTLRDWFAGQIVSALFTGDGRLGLTIGTVIPNDNNKIAGVAYAVADAMLAERDKPRAR